MNPVNDFEMSLERAGKLDIEMSLERLNGAGQPAGNNNEAGQAEIRPSKDSHRLFFVTPMGYVREIELDNEEKQAEFVTLVSSIGEDYPQAARIDLTHLMVHNKDETSQVIEADDKVQELTDFLLKLKHDERPFTLRHAIHRQKGVKGNAKGAPALSSRNKLKAPDDRLSKLPSSDKEIDELLNARLADQQDKLVMAKEHFFIARLLQKGLASILRDKQKALVQIENRKPEEERELRSCTKLLQKIEHLDMFAIAWANMQMIRENSLDVGREELLEFIEARPSARKKHSLNLGITSIGYGEDKTLLPEEKEYATDVMAMAITEGSWEERSKQYSTFIKENNGRYKSDSLEELLGVEVVESIVQREKVDWGFLSRFGLDHSLPADELESLEGWVDAQLFDHEISLDKHLETVDDSFDSICLGQDMRNLFREPL